MTTQPIIGSAGTRGRNRRPEAPAEPSFVSELNREGAEFVSLHHQKARAEQVIEGKKGHASLKEKIKTLLLNVSGGEDGHRTHLFPAPVVFEDGSSAKGVRLEQRGGGQVWDEELALAGLRDLGFTPRMIRSLQTTVHHAEVVTPAYSQTYLDEDKVVALLKDERLTMQQVRSLYRVLDPTYALSVIL